MFRILFPLAAALFSLPATAALVDAGGHSQHADVQVAITGFAQGQLKHDVSMDPFGAVWAGQLSGTLNGASFTTYCTDIFQTFRWGEVATYTPVSTGEKRGEQVVGFSERQADLMGKLYTLAGDQISTATTSAAFQLAVWEIVNEAQGPLNVSRDQGSFFAKTGSTAAKTQANTWLAAIEQADAARNYDATRLFNSSRQDFVIFSATPPAPAPNPVPEPASLALVGLALGAMTLVRRRPR